MAESKPVKRAKSLALSGEDIISSGQVSTLEAMAKEEIEIDVNDTVDFSSPKGRSALTWLLCLFFKIHIGEIGADGYSIGEIESKDLEGQTKMWFRNYRNSKSKLVGSNIVRHAKPTRSGREYGSDGDTSFGDT